jgi:hypothetical protein
MELVPRLIVPVVASGLLWVTPAVFPQSRPLPDEETFLQAARENLSRSNREQWRYAYKERRTELHMNPFGRLGTGSIVLYEVNPSPDGRAVYRHLLERDGKRVAGSEPERRERRQRQREQGGRSGIDDTVAALRFWIERRESLGGRDAIVVRFEPRPEARPSTREGRIAKVMKGTIWIDEAAREVVRAEATAIDDMSYGMGIIARLNEGTRVTVVRERIDDDMWLPTSIRFVGHGRAMLFRKLEIDHFIEWFDYRKVADAGSAVPASESRE